MRSARYLFKTSHGSEARGGGPRWRPEVEADRGEQGRTGMRLRGPFQPPLPPPPYCPARGEAGATGRGRAMQNATELCEAVGRPRMPAALLLGGAGIRKPSALAPLAASALALLPRVDSRVGDCAFERVALDVCDHGLAPRPGPTARRQGAGRRPAARAGTAQK